MHCVTYRLPWLLGDDTDIPFKVPVDVCQLYNILCTPTKTGDDALTDRFPLIGRDRVISRTVSVVSYRLSLCFWSRSTFVLTELTVTAQSSDVDVRQPGAWSIVIIVNAVDTTMAKLPVLTHLLDVERAHITTEKYTSYQPFVQIKLSVFNISDILAEQSKVK